MEVSLVVLVVPFQNMASLKREISNEAYACRAFIHSFPLLTPAALAFRADPTVVISRTTIHS